MGIPAERLSQVFEPFIQGDASTSRRFGGAGLGLSICRRLIECMGGRVGVTSVAGEGSRFWCEVPLALREASERPLCLPPTMDGVRVLVVDDNEVNRRVVHEQVVSLGLRNGVAASGAEALEILRLAHEERDPYLIVLLDDEMPEMDGETVAARVKADPALASTVLIMLTSGERWQERERLHDLGFSACLTRPIRQSQLMNALSTAWSRAGGALAIGDEPVPQPRAVHAAGDRARVMVAEDNIVNQRLAVRMLERLGCRVDVAANGLEVLQLVRIAPYDLILMDCEMPEMDGYEATAALRAEGPFKTIPIVATTAHAMSGERERCLAAGMDDYIAKPIRVADLERVLTRWPRRSATPSARAAASPGRDGTSLTAPVDPVVLSALREAVRRGGSTVVHEVCEALQRDARSCVETLRGAENTPDWGLVRARAEGLRLAAERLGARFLAWLCLELEESDERVPDERTRTIIDLVENELSRVVARLRQ